MTCEEYDIKMSHNERTKKIINDELLRLRKENKSLKMSILFTNIIFAIYVIMNLKLT